MELECSCLELLAMPAKVDIALTQSVNSIDLACFSQNPR